MTYNSSGPETSTAVVEGGAREVDLLGSEISFEINASAIPAAKLRELVRECTERHVDKRKLELLRIAEQIRARVSGEVGRNIWRGPVMSARHHRRRSPEATIQRAVFAHLRARGASGLFAFHPAKGASTASNSRSMAAAQARPSSRPSPPWRLPVPCIVEGLDRALAVLEGWGLLRGRAS